MNYSEALAWLYGTQQFGIKLGLENTERLLAALGIWDRARQGRRPKVIHVAGTNGKGSVCAFADSICHAEGLKVGLFTSPHLISFRERIRVNGEMISRSAVAEELTRIRHCISGWDPHPTFFEITTALGLDHFKSEECEVIILETGMGGRLDATNAVAPDVSVITPIDFDHEKWLGKSIVEIAGEKAGIIKPGTPVVSAPQRTEAQTVLKRRARECESPLEFVHRSWIETNVGLRGAHQKSNAALAVAALRAADIRVSEQAVARGLESVEWPARFQVFRGRDRSPKSAGRAGMAYHHERGGAPVIVLDGAHNPSGVQSLVSTWIEEFGQERAMIVLAILRDKNAGVVVDVLSRIAAGFVLPKIRSVRAIPPAELAELVSSRVPSFPCSVVASAGEAIEYAQNQSTCVLITGSLHFAGEVLAILRGEPESLEDSAQ